MGNSGTETEFLVLQKFGLRPRIQLMRRAKHYLVRGQVQGVGYRYFALEAAQRHQIRGYVRNLRGGEVEIHAEGEEPALELFKQELKEGPPMARVTNIEEHDLPVSGLYSSFLIRG